MAPPSFFVGAGTVRPSFRNVLKLPFRGRTFQAPDVKAKSWGTGG